jgi:GTP-binding protein
MSRSIARKVIRLPEAKALLSDAPLHVRKSHHLPSWTSSGSAVWIDGGHHRRSFSTAVENKETSTTLSKRQQFKQIPVHPSILQYIQSIGVGIPPRKQRRTVVQPGRRHRRRDETRLVEDPRKSKNKDEDNIQDNKKFWMPPIPFGKRPGTAPVEIIGTVGVTYPEKRNDDGNDNNKNKNDDNQEDEQPNDTYDDMPLPTFPRNESNTPEVALVGRSNVGKSTLLNALLYGNYGDNIMNTPKRIRDLRGRVPDNVKLPKGVKAIVSDKPGETKALTFYMLRHTNDGGTGKNQTNVQPGTMVETTRLTLVDMVGWGFAFAKDTQLYRKLLLSYLLTRSPQKLKRVLVLVDARHGIKTADWEFLELMQAELYNPIYQINDAQKQRQKKKKHTRIPPIQIVLTKCDLVTQVDLAKRVAQVRQSLSDFFRREPSQLPVMMVSAKAGIGYNNIVGQRARGGILELQKELAALAVTKLSNRQKMDDRATTTSVQNVKDKSTKESKATQ